jgi:hypothetical protein
MSYETRGGRTPRKGDIFHIKTPGENNDHVGIIVSDVLTDANGNWICDTAEGGQTGKRDYYKTKFYSQKKIEIRYGHHFMGERQVVKWIDLDALASSLVNRGLRAPVRSGAIATAQKGGRP